VYHEVRLGTARGCGVGCLRGVDAVSCWIHSAVTSGLRYVV